MKDNDVKRVIDGLTKHYSNTDNLIDFPKKKEILMIEKFAAQSLIEHNGELIFSKEKFAELIVRECCKVLESGHHPMIDRFAAAGYIKKHFGVETK